jgi:hypothetical protein
VAPDRVESQSQNPASSGNAIPVKRNAPASCRAATPIDLIMPSSKTPIWRDDIDALAFQPSGHTGLCMVHRRAFRTLLRAAPSPQQCVDFYIRHEETFQAAARAKLLHAAVAETANFHLTSRDVSRELKI